MAKQATIGCSMASLARADLASRLGISPSEIETVEVRPVQWPDAALGCPEPGKVYAAVITPGFCITLKVAGQFYEYHSDQRRVRLCSRGGHD